MMINIKILHFKEEEFTKKQATAENCRETSISDVVVVQKNPKIQTFSIKLFGQYHINGLLNFLLLHSILEN